MNRREFVAAAIGSAALSPKFPALAAPAEQPRPRFHLGAVTYNTLKDLDVESIIRVLEGAGFEGVELRTTHKHGVEPSISSEERTRVRRLFERSKIRLVSYGTTTRFQMPDAAERAKQVEIAKSFIVLAQDTGALGIKIQPMGLPPEVPFETSVRNFGNSLHELGDFGASRGVEIWVEVHGRGTSDPPVTAAIMKAANHKNVGICWNSNDTDIVNGSVKPSFELLKPWLKSAHINDLSSERYPWRELFSLMREAGYDRYTFMEIAESKELPRFLKGYRALWLELNRSCAA